MIAHGIMVPSASLQNAILSMRGEFDYDDVFDAVCRGGTPWKIAGHVARRIIGQQIRNEQIERLDRYHYRKLP